MPASGSTFFVVLVIASATAQSGCEPSVKAGACTPNVVGTPCERWRESICRYADDCDIDVDRCREQYAEFECRTDEVATRCADVFLSATCSERPKNCDFDAVADLEPAVRGCERYLRDACQSAFSCQVVTDEAQCTAEVDIDCARAVSLGARFEDCIRDIADIDCSAWVLPATCEDVVRVH